MDFLDTLLNLTKSFYPTGRAFRMPEGGYLEKLHKGLNASENRVLNDALSVLDSILPDNANFSLDDCTDWERRLGLKPSTASLSDRKAAILLKLNQPGINPSKENYLNLQYQLQLAGFNVFVYENKFSNGSGGFITKVPYQIIADSSLITYNMLGNFQMGQQKFGGRYNNKVANNLDPLVDKAFDTGTNFKSTFYISGATITTFATVQIARQQEFRQLILNLKPVQTVAFLFVHYT